MTNPFLIDDAQVTLTGNDWVTVCAALIQGGSPDLAATIKAQVLDGTKEDT